MDVTNVQLSAWRRVSHVYTEIYPHQARWTQTWVTTTFTVDLEMVYFCDSAADGKFSVRLLNSAGTSSVCLCWPGQCPPHSVDRMAVNDLQLHCAAKLTSLTTYWSIENYTSQCVVVFRTRCMGWVWMWTGFWTEPVSLTDCLHSASLLSLTFTMCVPTDEKVPEERRSGLPEGGGGGSEQRPRAASRSRWNHPGAAEDQKPPQHGEQDLQRLQGGHQLISCLPFISFILFVRSTVTLPVLEVD